MGLNITQIILATVFRMKDTIDFDGESQLSLCSTKKGKENNLTTAN